MAVVFTPESLKAVTVPVLLRVAEQDAVLTGPYHGGLVAANLATAQAATVPGSGFIPLVPEREFRQALAAGRSAAVWLQPAELPRERLALLGLPFDAARAGETVRAELMLHPSGQVLAVRFLN